MNVPNYWKKEHRFVEAFGGVLGNLSIVGYYDENPTIIQRPDTIIKRLIKAGILPEDCYVGGLQIGSLKRTALAVKPQYLIEYADEIMDYIEAYTDEIPLAAYNALSVGCMLAAFNGLVEFDSPLLKDLAPIIAKLDASMQTRIFTSKHLADQVFHKV